MHLKILGGIALVVVVLGLETSNAEAGYYMTYRQAKSETAEFAAESCRNSCVASRAGPCRRRSPRALSCVMVHTYAFLPEPGEEIDGPVEVDCHTLMHWGVNRRGYIVLKRASKPHCFNI